MLAAPAWMLLHCDNCGLTWKQDHGKRNRLDPYSNLYDPEVRTTPDLANALTGASLNAADAVFRDLKQNGANGGRLLDIGCALGRFVAAADHRGWQATGIDIAGNAVRWAVEHGLDCKVSTIEDFRPVGRYDAIVLQHVLEHLPDPLTTLKRICGWLTDTGLVYIRVPNAASAMIEKSRRNFIGHLKPFEHLFYFTPKSLELVMQKAGFAPNIRVTDRHLLADIVNYQIRSRIVLRASWTDIRYGTAGRHGTGSRLRSAYQRCLCACRRIEFGAADKEIVAVGRKMTNNLRLRGDSS